MKKVLSFILFAIVLLLLLSGCESIERMLHPNQTKVATIWVDNDEIAKYNFKGAESNFNGDTYCQKCDKFIEGKVRICPYCGQYV